MQRQIQMVFQNYCEGEFSHSKQNFLISSFCDRAQRCLLYAPEDGKYHNFEEENQNHFYVAASQFYKMLQKKSESIDSIEYIVNEKTLETFNSKKRFFEETKKGLNREGKVKELLLFHGTDNANIDSIVEKNFFIDAVPTHKTKSMAYGRGIYMSEHPEMALNYGKKLLLCRVSTLPHNQAHLCSHLIFSGSSRRVRKTRDEPVWQV